MNALMLSATEICALQDEKVRLEQLVIELRKEMEIMQNILDSEVNNDTRTN